MVDNGLLYVIQKDNLQFSHVFKVQVHIPAQKRCMSHYVRKINHELAIFLQLRNSIRQFSQFSIWDSIICFTITNSASDLKHLLEL